MDVAALLVELRELIVRHVGDERIEGLIVSRHESSERDYQLTEPLLVIMAQGGKRLYLDGGVLEYGAGDALVVTTTLPLSGHFLDASPESPALAIGLRLDPQAITAILPQTPETDSSTSRGSLGIAAQPASTSLLDAAVRMLRLLDDSGDSAFMASLIRQEVLWLLLRSPLGRAVAQIGTSDSDLNHVGRAIATIRQRLTEPIAVDELAREAGMSRATFHRHFRRITGCSPLQFQKTLRLQEARTLLLARATAAEAAGLVGYGSPTQFSREYRRYFGEPPVTHATRTGRVGT